NYAVTVAAIEECVGHRFGTVAELAARLDAVGWVPSRKSEQTSCLAASTAGAPAEPPCRSWLAATAARLPETIQSAAVINEALQRPAGWLERHAGIEQRRIWAQEDPLAAAAEAGRACLD